MIDEQGRLSKFEVNYNASQSYNVEALLNDEPLAKGYSGFLISADKERLDEHNIATIDIFYDNIGAINVLADTREKLHGWLQFIKHLNSHAHCINSSPEPKERAYPNIGYEATLTFKLEKSNSLAESRGRTISFRNN